MRLVRLILGDPDPRSHQEVEHDIDDELEFHLEQLVAEERALGKPPDAARLEANRRFGSLEHYRKLCLNVNLKERIMLQRINLGLLVLVAIGLGFTAWQSWAAQSRTATAVEGLSKQLAVMRTAPASNAAGVPTTSPPSSVTITGEVARSGVYNIPAEGLTLKRLMAAAGWNGKNPVNATIQRLDNGKQNATTAVTWAQLANPAAPADPQLQPGDLVIVTALDLALIVREPAKPDEHGKIADLGFSGRVLTNLPDVRDECFKEYDRVCAEAGLTTLAARTGTVLVVGAVERSGVYLLDSVKAKGEKVTLLDVVLAAGASPDIKTYTVYGRVAPEKPSSGGFPSALLYTKDVVLPFSDTIVVVSEDRKWFQSTEWHLLSTLDRPDTVVPTLATFTPTAAQEWERWQTLLRLYKDEASYSSLNKDAAMLKVSKPELITGAIDINDYGSHQRFIGINRTTTPSSLSLKALLDRVPNTISIANTKKDIAASRQPMLRLQLRMYDRLGGKSEPVLDLPLGEALSSDAVVPDGAYISVQHKKSD